MSFRKKRIALVRAAFLPVIAMATLVSPTWPAISVLSFGVELFGYLLLLTGLAIRLWSVFYIGGRKSHALITEGPYSVCRNPLYVGTFLVATGAALCFENLLMLVTVVAFVVPVHLSVVRAEERHLLELFPDAFRRYMTEVPRFWPAWRRYRSAECVSVSVRNLRRAAVDTVAVLLIPQAADLIEILHQHNVIPILLHFP